MASFAFMLPEHYEGALVTTGASERLLATPPHCGTQLLQKNAAGAWLVPADCKKVIWTANLIDHDSHGVDAAYPVGAWSAKHRLWLLTGRLPWLRIPHQELHERVFVAARARNGKQLSRAFQMPHRNEAPLYVILSLDPGKAYRSRGFSMTVYGDAPQYAWTTRLQRVVVQTWADWRRDVVPRAINGVDRLDVVWIKPPIGSDGPNFYASAGSDALFMQHVPGPDGADADEEMLKAVVLLTGAHEGFHSLISPLGQTWPGWVNESWASYFAFKAVKPHLVGESLTFASELVNAPSPVSLVRAQQAVKDGDQSQTLVFYSKGARFWSAIDAVLETPANRSGRLAALIQSTNGLRGVEWSNVAQVADYFDARSGGRAGNIVRCYFTQDTCPIDAPL